MMSDLEEHFGSVGVLRCRRILILIVMMLSGVGRLDAQLVREQNESLNLSSESSEESELLYLLEPAFPGISLDLPIAMATPPGETNRIFVTEKAGKIQMLPELSSTSVVEFLDLGTIVWNGEQGFTGLAFHPDYASNGYFYVFYTAMYDSGLGDEPHILVSRFSVSVGNPNQADPDSELVLLHQRNPEPQHQGGDLHFGDDGYLYVSIGDGASNGSIGFDNAQTITNGLFSGILRIDVDSDPSNLLPNPHPSNDGVASNYRIPVDNPFVGATNFNGAPITEPSIIRTEFFAVGLRNPFRMSFDRPSGRLYCGDVGRSLKEEVNLIVKGGNYGWPYREGHAKGPRFDLMPPGFIENPLPLLSFFHGTLDRRGNSVIGGIVYRGDTYPELHGRYIFGDYLFGNVWSIYYDGVQVSEWNKLLRAPNNQLVSFFADPHNGDILISMMLAGRIDRLVRNQDGASTTRPPTLAETGVFADLETLEPQAGVVPYEINVPFWSDTALKHRWFTVPDTNRFMSFSSNEPWQFPTGSVWIKHFEIEVTNGIPESARRLETRILVKTETHVEGFTYSWGSSETNATLVPEDGFDEVMEINDAGVIRTQVWHYPSRDECLACHTPASGGVLGFNTAQLNREKLFDGETKNQILAYRDAGYFDTPVGGEYTWRALAAATNEAYSIEYRVRSWLAVNCAQCHIPGNNPAVFDARLYTPLSETELLFGLLNNGLGDSQNRVIVPGDESHSALLTRISSLEAIRMPPIGTSVVDTQAVALVSDWIQELTNHLSFAEWQQLHFGSTNLLEALPGADADGDLALNRQEWLVRTDPNDPMDVRGITSIEPGEGISIRFEQVANRGYEIQWTENVFDENWMPLNAPYNQPFFSAFNLMRNVSDAETSAHHRIYRLRVYEP